MILNNFAEFSNAFQAVKQLNHNEVNLIFVASNVANFTVFAFI
ncbi:hypothetical protein SAMN05444355_101135 [Flavobacterium frigoris]|uniref:Uncharacterized protein n=1 Tax=Flavobacterium frigoris TaxID=229204 RepID=A0A1H9CC71_FLAFI|nr:hypothetical protein SAMN05444355_101135 [Flavobacterium frigoris]